MICNDLRVKGNGVVAEGWLAVWIAAIFAGGVLSALTQSLRDVSRTGLEARLGTSTNTGLRDRVAKIVGDLEGHATAITLPRIACNLVAVVAMVIWITAVRGLSQPGWIETTIGVVATSGLIWVFGSVIPTAIARHAAAATVVACATIIRLAYVAARPVLALSGFADTIVRRLAGREDVDRAEAVQAEILNVVEEARHEGQFDEYERDMIEAVVHFKDSTVAQIMTPRTQVEALAAESNLGQVTAFIRRVGHSRVPVYEGDLDHILGVFYVKDLMKWLAGERPKGGQGFDLKALLRPSIFVPETKTVRELLSELLEKRVHIAIVADEFGGTAGLVTFEDIVESVFGDIQDEYEQPHDGTGDMRIDADRKTAEIDAKAYIEDVNDDLDQRLGVRIPESQDYDTVGGFVTVTSGRIPGAGEHLELGTIAVEVLEAEPTRLTRVRISPRVVQAPAEDATGAPPDAPTVGRGAA